MKKEATKTENQPTSRAIANTIQPNLQISQPGDSYEREADEVAEKVMSPMPSGEQVMDAASMPATALSENISPFVARQEDEEELQLKAETGPEASPWIARQLDGQGGSTMPSETRSFMESRFGADFGDVKIHNDNKSHEMSRHLNAQAFTSGQDIYFNTGKYDPVSREGKHLLAHELTHVVQQKPGLKRIDRKPQSNIIQRAGNYGDVDIRYTVPLIPQPTRVSCWAAALAMVINHRDGTTKTPAQVAAKAGMDLTTGYGWSSIQAAVSAWSLSTTPPVSALPTYWNDLLIANGPLWIVEVGAPYHAVVVYGMYGTGDYDSTEVWIRNPWPPNVGATEYKTFEDFDREFGLGAGAGAMIVHK